MKGRSRKGCVMGTSIHKNKASSPVKFLGGIVDAGRGMIDNVRGNFQNITPGNLPPPPTQQPMAGDLPASMGGARPGRNRLQRLFHHGRPDQLV